MNDKPPNHTSTPHTLAGVPLLRPGVGAIIGNTLIAMLATAVLGGLHLLIGNGFRIEPVYASIAFSGLMIQDLGFSILEYPAQTIAVYGVVLVLAAVVMMLVGP